MDISNVYNYLDNYFYGINFDNCTVEKIKRFDNDKQEIFRAYNEAERLDTYALIKSLFIEKYILESNLSKIKDNESISKLYNEFRERCSVILAVFTNDLMKKIGRSIDVEKASKLFEVFDSVDDALIYIYKLCRSEFIEVSKESNYIDEKELKRNLLHEFKKLVEENFEPISMEYDIAFKHYQTMFHLINNSSLEEFVEIFKKSYSEVLRDVESKKENIK